MDIVPAEVKRDKIDLPAKQSTFYFSEFHIEYGYHQLLQLLSSEEFQQRYLKTRLAKYELAITNFQQQIYSEKILPAARQSFRDSGASDTSDVAFRHARKSGQSFTIPGRIQSINFSNRSEISQIVRDFISDPELSQLDSLYLSLSNQARFSFVRSNT